jgi:origin recognition complex subunit 3|eukprot:g8627.t1
MASLGKSESIVDSVFHYKSGSFKSTELQLVKNPRWGAGESVFPSCYGAESVDAVQMRYEAFTKCFLAVQHRVSMLSTDLNESAFHSISDFFREAYGYYGCANAAGIDERGGDETNDNRPLGAVLKRDRFLPACIVCAGLNLSDHGTTHRHLRKHLRSTCTPHVVSLFARNCETTAASLKHLSKILVESLRSESVHEDNDLRKDGDDLDPSAVQRSTRGTTQALTTATDAAFDARNRARRETKFKNKVKHLSDLSPLGDVEEWYKYFYGGASESAGAQDEDAEKKEAAKRVVLVVCLEDFEFFKPGVIQDLLVVMSKAHRRGLPLAVLLGVASVTGADAVHSRIPRPVTNLLWLRTVRLEKSLKTMDQVISALFISRKSDFPLRLSHRLLRWVSDRFLEYTFSVSSFIRCLHFAVMEYHFSTRLAYLSRDLGDLRDRDSILPQAKLLVNKMGLKDCKHIFGLSSVMATQMGEAGLDLKNANAAVMKDMIANWLVEIHVYKKLYGQVFMGMYEAHRLCVAAARSNSDQSRMGSDKRNSHLHGIRRAYIDSIENPEYWKAMVGKIAGAIRRGNLGLIEKIAKLWEQTLSGHETSGDEGDGQNQNVQFATYFGEEKQTIRGVLDSIASDNTFDASRLVGSSVRTETSKISSKRRRLNTENMANGKFPDCTSMLEDLLSTMNTLASKYLKSIATFPMHELFVLKKKTDIQKLFGAQPRKQVIDSLSRPWHYLSSLEDHSQSINKHMPDSSILFALMGERGKNVNLYDWFQSFCTIIHDSASTGTRKGSSLVQDMLTRSDIQSRFIRGIADLQYIGCFLPEGRKGDHVSRIVYGI